jgi:hypothetical protein
VELEENPVKKVRILGEDLVLYSPAKDLILKVFEEADEWKAKGQPLLPMPEAPAYDEKAGQHVERVLMP